MSTCTYNEALVTAADQLRFAVGDTDAPDDCVLTNGEVAWVLTQASNNVTTATLPAARAALRKLARVAVDATLGDISVKASQMMANFKAVIADIQSGQVMTATPYAGGISRSDKATGEADGDRSVPFFTRETGDERRATDEVWPS